MLMKTSNCLNIGKLRYLRGRKYDSKGKTISLNLFKTELSQKK